MGMCAYYGGVCLLLPTRGVRLLQGCSGVCGERVCGRHPSGKQRQRHLPVLTSSGSQCSGRYASYAKIFLFLVCLRSYVWLIAFNSYQ